MSDWTNMRQVSDPDEIDAAMRRAWRIKASPSAMDEMRRRFPKSDPPPSFAASLLCGTPIDIDSEVPEGFAAAGGVLLDFRAPEFTAADNHAQASVDQDKAAADLMDEAM